MYTNREELTGNAASFHSGSWYSLSLNNSQGVRIASVDVLFPSGVLATGSGRATMMVSVWHEDGTHLDSFDLTLSSPFAGTSLDAWLLPQSGGDSMQITNWGTKTVIHFVNLDFYGVGTVGYDLLLQLFPYPLPSNYQLNLDASILLHETNGFVVRHSYAAQLSEEYTVSPNWNITLSRVGIQ